MRFLILLLSFGLSTEWGTSISVRTPNDDIHPLDYELSIKLDDNEGKFRYNLKRDWERELGEKYIDDEMWFTFEPNGIPLYMKPQYVNKTSRDLKYSKLDTRYKKDWFSLGHTALMSEDVTEQGLSVGIHNKWKVNGTLEFESKFDGYYFRDEVLNIRRLDLEEYLALNWKINEKLTLSNILDYNDVKGKKYYKFKVGVEYKLGD